MNKFLKGCGLLFICLGLAATVQSQTLAERLGYTNTDRLLIITCDDVGMFQAANQALLDGQTKGILTSGSLMVPCPESGEAIAMVKQNPKLEIGIQLTLTSEWKNYRWGGIAPPEKIKKLVDKDGNFWRSIEDLYHNATPLEAYYEAKAQIKKVIEAGISPTHLTSHMEALQLMVPYVDAYLQLAAEFNLPVRMASQTTLAELGQANVRQKFSDMGIVFPDFLIYDELENYPAADIKTFWTGIIKGLKPGVTEIYIHPGLADDELKKIAGDWKSRNAEYELFTNDKEFAQMIRDEGIILIGYKALLNLQQKKVR